MQLNLYGKPCCIKGYNDCFLYEKDLCFVREGVARSVYKQAYPDEDISNLHIHHKDFMCNGGCNGLYNLEALTPEDHSDKHPELSNSLFVCERDWFKCEYCGCDIYKPIDNMIKACDEHYKLLYMKYYYRNNKDKFHNDKTKEQQKRWREEHPNEMKEYKREWEKNNPEKLKKSRDKASKKFKLNHPNYSKEYYQKNKDYLDYIQRCYNKACSIYKDDNIDFW
jgi:hypothetical protein